MPKNFQGLQYLTSARFEALRDGQVLEIAEETIDAIELNPDLPADYFKCPKWEVDASTIATKEVGAEMVVKYEHRGPYSDVGTALRRGGGGVLGSGRGPL